MAQYTMEAFKWSGTGYNQQYNTSHTATFDDDDPLYQGGGDANESVSIDGGAFGPTAYTPYEITVSFVDTNGIGHIEKFAFFNTGGAWYFIPEPGSAFTVGATLGSYQSHTSSGWNYADVACFAAGTLIETDTGPVDVLALAPGDRIKGADGAYYPLRRNMTRAVSGLELARNPKLRPVRIVAGALGENLPERDLLVSRQHRMAVNSPVAKRMFGTRTVLVSAIKLTAFPGIYVDEDVESITYCHLVLDEHQMVLAEGAPSESLLVGPQVMNTLTDEQREEMLALFPKLATNETYMVPAAEIPRPKRQKQLVDRLVKNQKPALQGDLRCR